MPSLWKDLARRALFALDAERAHEIGMKVLTSGVLPRQETIELPVERFGLRFHNPLGVAAGFDKNGVAVNALAGLGFGFVEVGTVTARAQSGNPKPRLFRLREDKALLNRLGFNNDGAGVVAARLRKIDRQCIVGVNIGRNRDVSNEDATENYLESFDAVFDVADYIAVNVSSPNTSGLRDLQAANALEMLLQALMRRNVELAERSELDSKPLLVKIAPDLDAVGVEMIAEVALRTGLSGIIATNTTISRQGLRSANVSALGEGGISGRPVSERSTEVISQLYCATQGKLPIIGVGGIFTALDAFEKIRAGASLVQTYTGFVYEGPTFASDVVKGLQRLIDEAGYSSFDDAVGSSNLI